ncbi:hypothetical protein MSBRM_0411 [Methanosarcina barkeri MS]|uniref:Uncharacterized protein n=1 Tax=Methanosarcina barkeri MS TaxID=1434108 RepID=A0A0E3QRI2_METBA|nr:hypothetical protein MSBRM_0411 [Methanosarcina barkeri MS]
MNTTGKPLYIISLDEEFYGKINVIQPKEISDLEAKVEQMEKTLCVLRIRKKNKISGPAGIRIQDLRRVKALFQL